MGASVGLIRNAFRCLLSDLRFSTPHLVFLPTIAGASDGFNFAASLSCIVSITSAQITVSKLSVDMLCNHKPWLFCLLQLKCNRAFGF